MMSHMKDDVSAQFLSPDSIALTEAQVGQAIDLAQAAATEAEQWQTYLTSLALLGLQDWLDKRSPELKIESDFLQAEPSQADLRPKHHATRLSQQVSKLQIAQTQIQLLTTDFLADPLVTAPKLGVEAQPDFYLLVEVLEELAEVRVRGYLPQAKFNAIQLEAQLAVPLAAIPTPDLVFLPIQAFNPDPAGLLLHLRAQLTAAQMQQANATTLTLPASLINLALWLQDRLDQAAEALSWHLLPPSALNLSGALMGGAMRERSSDLNAVIRELQGNQGIVIPASARAGERDLELEEIRLRLYVLTWVPQPGQWALLLIVGAQPVRSYALPVGLTLKVEADQDLLAEERLRDHPYLYSLVVGTPEEQFRVTVTAPTGAALTLTPFGFDPSPEPC